MGTGRTCDGYDSIFRPATGKPRTTPLTRSIASDHTSIPSFMPTFFRVTCQDTEVLSRYFSTKTLWGIRICYEAEAKQVLQASVSDPAVRHAVLSLGSLRESLEAFEDVPFVIRPTPKFCYGVQQYSIALGSLARNLSNPSCSTLKSAILCCQVFISIELIRNDHAAATQHFNRGLNIMHQYRARAGFNNKGIFIPRGSAQVPSLDVFVIKMYAAPCKFTDLLSHASDTTMLCTLGSGTGYQRPNESSKLPKLAPDSRTQLARIAGSVLYFLDKISRVTSQEEANPLIFEKMALIKDLEEWEASFQSFRGPENSENLMLANVFTLLLYQILKVVMTMALDSSLEVNPKLRAEFDWLDEIARKVSERAQKHTLSCQKSNYAYQAKCRGERATALCIDTG